MFSHRWLRSQAGFTLIELLVTILIVGILIAVAAPSFLGQTQKAHDSEAQQYLTVAYKAATAWAVDHKGAGTSADSACASAAQGDYCSTAGVVAAIAAFEPSLTASTGSCPAGATGDPKHIIVAAASSGSLVLCNDPQHTVWTLRVENYQLMPFESNSLSTFAVVAPSSIAAPVISGVVQVGSQLTTSTGTWANSPTGYSYQWQRSANGSSWSNISSATASSYVVASADYDNYLRVVVSATNSGGSTAASSLATALVLSSAPVNTVLPIVTGTIQVGQTVTASTGQWSSESSLSYTFQWQTSTNGSTWADVAANGNSQSYAIQPSDYNQYLHVVVQAQNSVGSASAASATPAQATASAAPVNTALPAILGTAQEGQTLTASSGNWTSPAAPSYVYQWQVSSDNGSSWASAAGSGNATSSYTVANADIGSVIRVRVTASNSGGSALAYSTQTATVTGAPPVNTLLPSVSGTLQVGSTLTAGNGTWNNTPSSYAYVWQRCDLFGNSCAAISAATAQTYVLQSADLNDTIRVVVTATNAYGSANATSTQTAQIDPSAGSSSVSSAVLGDGPVAFYQFDEPAGSTSAADSSGNGLNLAASSVAPTFGVASVAGLNTAVQFSGTQRLAATNSLFAITGSISLEAWVKTTNTTNAYNMLIGYGYGSNASGGYGLGTDNSGRILFYNSGYGFFNSTGTVNDGAWHHIAVTDSPSTSTITFYKDGVQVGTVSSGASPTTNGGNIFIGRTYDTTHSYIGSADNLAIFNKALTASQVAAHAGIASAPSNSVAPTVSGTATIGSNLTGTRGTWSGSSPLTYAYQWQRCLKTYSDYVVGDSPLAYYHLDETSGTSFADSSGNGRNLAISGSPALGAAGAVNTAATFSTSGQSASAASSAFGLTGALTLEAWVKTTSTTSYNFAISTLGNDSNGHTVGFGLGTDGGHVFVYTGPYPYGNYYESAAVSANDGNWHYIAAVISSSTSLSIYKDGSLLTTISGSNLLPSAPASPQLRIGGGTWVGSIDEPALYASALTATKIQSHYSNTTPSCSDIASANSLGYTVQSADSTYKLRLKVTGTNSLGSASAASGYTAFVP